MQFKLLLEIKLPVVLLPLIHCFDCIFVCYTIPIMHFWVSHISKKQWNLLCYPSWVYVLFFMFKARGSSMKRGSFNKKRSVKRKSTKVCVVIISDIKKIFCFVNGKGPFVVCLTIITDHWSQQHYRRIMSELLITTDALISSDYFSESQYCYVQF